MRQIKIFLRAYKQIISTVPFSAVTAVCWQMVQGIMPAVLAVVMGLVCDYVYTLQEGIDGRGRLFGVIAIYIVITVIARVMDFLAGIVVNAKIYEKCDSMFRLQIMQKSAKLPLIAYEDSSVLDKKQRAVRCVDREILGQIYMECGEVIVSLIALASLVSIMLSYHVWLVAGAVVSVIPFFFSRLLRGKEFYELQYARAEKSRLSAYLACLFRDSASVKEMRVMDYSDVLKQKWKTVNDEIIREDRRLQNKENNSFALCDFIKVMGYCASVMLATVLCVQGEISVGMLGSCMIAFRSLQDGIVKFFTNTASLPRNISFAGDFFSFLDLSEEEMGEVTPADESAGMRLEHVSFTYPNQQEPALADISLKIGDKEKIVLVGVNGSGKSTLCKLITGAYQPDEGRVLWAEADLRTINKISLYQKTAMAPQLFTQFHLTVRENVALADLRRMDEDISVREAAEKTGLASALEEIGLDSMLGREFGGSELSGGQWQRLLLSRAIFKRGEVLILDEPTSALDPDTEYDILNSFLKMAEEKTALIVSHRVGLCRMADRVIFLEQGRIAADGPHDTLMRTNPSYRRFYEAQSKWYQSGIIR